MELPDCIYPLGKAAVTIIPPSAPTPKDSLYLSNLDDQKFLRFSIKYFYIFRKSICLDRLKSSLSRVLVDYYPLAGRLRRSHTTHVDSSADDDHKLEVDCNGEGAMFAEAFMAITADQLLQPSKLPNKSWKKFLHKLEAHTFVDVPLLLVQITSLSCGGMILCTAINHCVCDGIGTSQFLHAWAEVTKRPEANLTILPFHWRHVLKPREPPKVNFCHPGYIITPPPSHHALQFDLLKLIQSHEEPLIPTSFTFNPSHVLSLKKQCVPPCTTFEVVAAHTWRSWIRSLVDLSLSSSSTLTVKLLFSVNVRRAVKLPKGYYGNGFILGCAKSSIKELVSNNLEHGVKLVQEAKATVNDEEYVRSVIDLLEDKTVKTDLSTSLVISQWSKLGLEEVDFGEGKPLHMGPLTSDVYCLFLPVINDFNAVRVLISVPQTMVDTFQYHMTCIKNGKGNVGGDLTNT